MLTRPSVSSSAMASRIGVLDTRSRVARSLSTSLAPGGISSSTIMSRMASYAARL